MHNNSNNIKNITSKVHPKRKRKIRLAGAVQKFRPVPRNFRSLPEIERRQILEQKRNLKTVTLYNSDSDFSSNSDEEASSISVHSLKDDFFADSS